MRCSVGVSVCPVCLTVFVNCLVKQFAMCLFVVAILLLNVMDVFVWVEVLYRVWSSKECACDPCVHLSVPSIGFVCVFVCRKLSPHLRAESQVCSPYVVSLCDFTYYVVG